MNTLMVRVNDKSTINKCRTEGRVEGDTNMDPRNGDATCMVVPVRHYAWKGSVGCSEPLETARLFLGIGGGLCLDRSRDFSCGFMWIYLV